MSRKSKPLVCSEEDRTALEAIARSRSAEARLVERAKIVLECLKGAPVKEIARGLRIRPNTVIARPRRFERDGMAGLYDRPRSGKPARYGREFRDRLLKLLEQPPPPGQACWDGAAAARALKASTHAVWRGAMGCAALRSWTSRERAALSWGEVGIWTA